MTDDTHEGWTNYQTWRVNLEMFDGNDYTRDNELGTYELGEVLRGEAIEIIESESTGLATDYATAFLNEVNWYEIAGHQIESYRE